MYIISSHSVSIFICLFLLWCINYKPAIYRMVNIVSQKKNRPGVSTLNFMIHRVDREYSCFRGEFIGIILIYINTNIIRHKINPLVVSNKDLGWVLHNMHTVSIMGECGFHFMKQKWIHRVEGESSMIMY